VSEAQLQALSYEECLQLLREHAIGRIGVVLDDAPFVLPVNYRLVETVGLTFVAVRTRPGNTIDRAGLQVAFEIDEVDLAHRQGWSVLVRGTLHHVDADAAGFKSRFDSHPWIEAERDAWLIIQPFSITGRQLHPATHEWAFHIRAYL
jgi:nitroimidazol reductase NimA-like FMN-containing flavoprotein (pyridoxamine 5'-phosphate oxidase superfamily)